MTRSDLPNGWPRSLPLPVGWSAPLLSEVAHRESGHTPEKDVQDYWNGGIKWLSLTDCDRLNRIYVSDTSKTISQAGIEHSSARLLPAGVVVLSRDAGVGQSAITTCSMAVSQHFLAWQCSERLDPLFLYYWFQHLRPELERVAVGSTIKTIGLWYFDRMRIPLPPIQIQCAVAAALKELDCFSGGVERMIDAKRTFKRGLMQQLLAGQKRFPEFRDRPWTFHRFDTLCEELSDRNGKQIGADHVMGVIKGVGLEPMRERVRGKGDLARYKIVPPGAFAYNPMRLNIGSIAFNDSGRSILVSPDYVVFRPRTNVAAPEFINQLRYSSYWTAFMRRAGAGSVRVRIYFSDLARLRVPTPALDEQKRIADALRLVDAEIAQLAKLHELRENQKTSLLTHLLNGQLSVQVR